MVDLLTAAELHARWPEVAPATIKGWRSEGMPAVESIEGQQKRVHFDLAACEKWRSENKGASVMGGAKANGGRKPKGAEPEPPEGGPTSDGILERIAGMTHEEIMALAAAPPDVSGFTPNQASRLAQLLKAQKDAMEIAERRGELVEIEPMRRTLTIGYGKSALILRGFEAGLADEVIAAGGIEGEDKAAAVRAAIVRGVDRVCEALAGVTV